VSRLNDPTYAIPLRIQNTLRRGPRGYMKRDEAKALLLKRIKLVKKVKKMPHNGDN